MSGGHFDYNQYRIDDIADSIEDYIYGHPLEEENIEYYIKDNWLENEEKEYVINNKHTIPNYYGYNEETLEEFKKGLDILRKACIYAQRIDWLLSGDDGEESFHKRLKEDLEKYYSKIKGINHERFSNIKL